MIRSPIKRANDRFYTKDGSTSQFDDFFNHSIWFNGAEIIIDEGLRNIETDDTIEKKEVPHIERYLCETLFSSVVDNFQCYLSEILLHIFDERPELLSSGSTKNSLIFSHDDILSLKRSIVEQTVLGLGYKRIDELDRYFLENFK